MTKIVRNLLLFLPDEGERSKRASALFCAKRVKRSAIVDYIVSRVDATDCAYYAADAAVYEVATMGFDDDAITKVANVERQVQVRWLMSQFCMTFVGLVHVPSMRKVL